MLLSFEREKNETVEVVCSFGFSFEGMNFIPISQRRIAGHAPSPLPLGSAIHLVGHEGPPQKRYL